MLFRSKGRRGRIAAVQNERNDHVFDPVSAPCPCPRRAELRRHGRPVGRGGGSPRAAVRTSRRTGARRRTVAPAARRLHRRPRLAPLAAAPPRVGGDRRHSGLGPGELRPVCPIWPNSEERRVGKGGDGSDELWGSPEYL